MTRAGPRSAATERTAWFSRALKDYNPFETLPLKKVESHVSEGCSVLRTLWHVMSPPMGHVGVASASKWDIDETCFYIACANRLPTCRKTCCLFVGRSALS